MRKPKKKLTLLPMTLLMASSCATLPERPDTYLCVINALGNNRKCYNMKEDFDVEGNLLDTAVPFYQHTTSIDDLDKQIVIDQESFTNLKIYLKELRTLKR